MEEGGARECVQRMAECARASTRFVMTATRGVVFTFLLFNMVAGYVIWLPSTFVVGLVLTLLLLARMALKIFWSGCVGLREDPNARADEEAENVALCKKASDAIVHGTIIHKIVSAYHEEAKLGYATASAWAKFKEEEECPEMYAEDNVNLHLRLGPLGPLGVVLGRYWLQVPAGCASSARCPRCDQFWARDPCEFSMSVIGYCAGLIGYIGYFCLSIICTFPSFVSQMTSNPRHKFALNKGIALVFCAMAVLLVVFSLRLALFTYILLLGFHMYRIGRSPKIWDSVVHEMKYSIMDEELIDRNTVALSA